MEDRLHYISALFFFFPKLVISLEFQKRILIYLKLNDMSCRTLLPTTYEFHGALCRPGVDDRFE